MRAIAVEADAREDARALRQAPHGVVLGAHAERAELHESEAGEEAPCRPVAAVDALVAAPGAHGRIVREEREAEGAVEVRDAAAALGCAALARVGGGGGAGRRGDIEDRLVEELLVGRVLKGRADEHGREEEAVAEEREGVGKLGEARRPLALVEGFDLAAPVVDVPCKGRELHHEDHLRTRNLDALDGDVVERAADVAGVSTASEAMARGPTSARRASRAERDSRAQRWFGAPRARTQS